MYLFQCDTHFSLDKYLIQPKYLSDMVLQIKLSTNLWLGLASNYNHKAICLVQYFDKTKKKYFDRVCREFDRSVGILIVGIMRTVGIMIVGIFIVEILIVTRLVVQPDDLRLLMVMEVASSYKVVQIAEGWNGQFWQTKMVILGVG